MFIGIFLIVFILWFFALNELLTKMLPVPKKIQKLETLEERNKQFALYVAYFVAIFHGPIFSSISAYFVIQDGVHYNQQNPYKYEVVLMVLFY